MELERYRVQLEQMVEYRTRELLANQERLLSLSNNLPGGVIYRMIDDGVKTRFTHVSAYFADMFGVGVEELMNDSALFYAAVHIDDRRRLAELLATAGGNEIDAEYRICTRSGRAGWVQMRASFRPDDSGARVWDGFMIDITARKTAERELEDTRGRQAALIRMLQIVQSAQEQSETINAVLAEAGRHVKVSRVYIFEKSADGCEFNNTCEWCADGITPMKHRLQNIPCGALREWTEIFDAGKSVQASDVGEFSEHVAKELTLQGIRSVFCMPLKINGVNSGFVGFDDCESNREWNKNEAELLTGLSQIIATAMRRYSAENAVRLSQQAMRTVLDNINACIFVTDLDTSKILFANRKSRELADGEVEGRECWKVFYPSANGMCSFCQRAHLLDDEGNPAGFRRWENYNKRTNQWFENINAAIEWVDGNLVQIEYSTDITDRKRAEEAVRRSEEMYRQLVVASPDAIVVSDTNGRIRYVSAKAVEMFGIEGNIDDKIRYILEFVHPYDRQQADTLFCKLAGGAEIPKLQLSLLHRDGSDFFGEVSSASVKDNNSKITSLIMVIRDVTQWKQNEMELIRAREKAEESDRLKSAFLANMSHEIRTPLNGIVGFLSFLGADILPPPQQRREYISVINNSSQQLVRLLNDIVDIARIDAGQMSINAMPVQINDVMKELELFFDNWIRADNRKRITLVMDDSRFVDNCTVYIDPTRLRQVLNNLLNNAVKFTEKGFIRFGYGLSENQLEFVVEDSGIGLSDDQLEIIFERFRQAEFTTSHTYGGTGLGLAISRSLVRLMGGEMWVDSVKGIGSSFHFTIPSLPVAPQDAVIFGDGKTPVERKKPLAGKTVLVAEPGLLRYMYYEKMLSAGGATVIQAKNLRQWLDVVMRLNRVDAVLAGIAVFDDDAADDAQQIKSIRTGLPLILVVPGQNASAERIVRDSRCDMILEEPLDYRSIMIAMKRLVK
jgi:PAS domain S-box-containing protein